MLLPRHCAVCRSVGPPLCPACASLLVPAPDPPPLTGIQRCVALFAYEGAGREVVARLKYANHRDALVPLGSALAAAVDRPVDLVTWIPTSARRRQQRGYDQARLLAGIVGRHLRAPVRATLRPGGRAPQTGRSRADRWDARFEPRGRLPAGSVVVVVDDVRTTGASLSAAGSVLHAVGAEVVIGATLAATPADRRAASSAATSAAGTTAGRGRRSLPGRGGDPLQSG